MASCCQSSGKVPLSSYHIPTTAFPHHHHRRRKLNKKGGDEAELPCPKPQLSLMRDRDKRFNIILPAVSLPPTSSPSSSSTSLPGVRVQVQEEDDETLEEVMSCRSTRNASLACKRQEEKTNGSIATNNCPMTLLHYLCRTDHFSSSSSRFSSMSTSCYFCWNCSSCHYGLSWSHPPHYPFHNGNSNNKSSHSQTKTPTITTTNTGFPLLLAEMKGRTGDRPFIFKGRMRLRKARNFVSSLIPFLILWLGILSPIIHCSNASPIKSALSSSQSSPPPPSSSSSPTLSQTITVINKQVSPNEGEYENGNMKNLRRFQRGEVRHPPKSDDGHHHHIPLTNNSLVEVDGDDGSRQSKLNEKRINMSTSSSEQMHSMKNFPGTDRSRDSSSGNSGGNGRASSSKFTSGDEHASSNSSHDSEIHGMTESRYSANAKTPLALNVQVRPLIISPSSSSSSVSPRGHRQRKKGVIQVTNELSLGGGFDDDDQEEAEGVSGGNNNFVHLSNDNNRRENDDGIKDSTHNSSQEESSSPGLCRFYALSLNEDEGGNMGIESTTFSYSTLSPKYTPAGKSPMSPIGALCNGTRNLTLTLQEQIPENLASRVISLRIKDSSISTLNLSLFHRFPRLTHLSVTHSNVSHVIGTCPKDLLSLNISYNVVRRVDSTVFLEFGNPDDIYEEEDQDLFPDDDSVGDDDNEGSDRETGDNDLKDNTISIESHVGRNRSREGVSNFGDSVPSSREKPQQRYNCKSGYPSFNSKSSQGKLSPSRPSRLERHHQSRSENSEMGMSSSTPTTMALARKLINGRESRSAYSTLRNDSLLDDHGESHPTDLRQRKGKAGANANHDVPTAALLNGAANTTNESNDDGVAHHGGDNNGSVPAIKEARRGYNDSDIIKRGEKISNGGDKDKEQSGNTVADDCSNNSLCKAKSGPLPRRRRTPVIRVKEAGTQAGDEQDIGSNEEATQNYVGELKSESYTSGQAQVRTNAEGDGDYFHLVNALSLSSTSGAADMDSTAGNDDDISGSNKEVGEEKVVGESGSALLPLEEKVGLGMRIRRSIRLSSEERMSTAMSGALALEDVDLSHNKISEVPRALLELKSLKSLRLSGNQLKCDFVWDKLADWYTNGDDPYILKDGDDTFCGVVDDVRVFQFTVLSILRAKRDLVETCSTVDKAMCRECGLYSLNKQPGHGYNFSHQSPRGNVAIALKLDCSYSNLTELPPVPPQTWQLNVSGNAIKDLGLLKEPMYENLLILDADSNEISTLDELTGTSFLDKYNYLSLQNNRFTTIPTNFLSSLKNMRGQGITFLGANFIDCDCEIVKEIKPLLLENSKQIKDLKEIYCKDMKTPSGESYVALKNLQYTDLCYLDTAESNEMYLYLVILIEVLLILVIVAKVWHDQRTFRRTGILPWCSAKMPRLPCDAMLESVKEPPHFNRSSSTNVRSFACDHPTAQSISSHVQLRDVRSNSGQSEKSSQISQLSSFPSSSRTSSV